MLEQIVKKTAFLQHSPRFTDSGTILSGEIILLPLANRLLTQPKTYLMLKTFYIREKRDMKRKPFKKKLAIFFLKILARLFFSDKYLRGRWFEDYTLGWRWVWRSILWQKILGFNRHCSWPVSPFIKVGPAENIIFDVDDLNNFQDFGSYFQCFAAKIIIGKGTYIGPNVGIITANHDPLDLDRHLLGKDVVIGKSCWIGMNAVILPGVHIGDHTVVGAGSVVTKSFPEGKCVIAGCPSKVVKYLA